MKKMMLLIGLLPVVAMAQSNSGMPMDMQKMMEQAMKAQACMEDIDTSEFDRIEQEGRAKEAEIKALCEAGNRDEAQDTAIAYSREMMQEPAMKKVRECSEHLRGMLPSMPFDNFEEEFKNKHICDEMN